MQKANKKVGGEEKYMDTRRPYIWIPDVDRLGWKKMMKRVGVVGVVFTAVFLAVWAAMPANGAEAAFSCDTGTVN